MKPTAVSFLIVTMLLSACASAPAKDKEALPANVKAILDKSESIDLYSLEPEPDKGQKGDELHGWLILGKTTLKDKSRKTVLEAVEKGIGSGKGAKCFDPRHAIRAKHDGKTVDLLICFACGWVYVYERGKRTSTLTIDRKTQETLDKVLTDAKVKLAKQQK
jgi:hypothetical protein